MLQPCCPRLSHCPVAGPPLDNQLSLRLLCWALLSLPVLPLQVNEWIYPAIK